MAAGVAREISRRRPGARKDERWLSRAWERQAFDRHNLRSTSGVAFQVVYPGHCTGQAGPDFHDAILALGSVPLPVLEQRMQQFIADGGENPAPAASRATP